MLRYLNTHKGAPSGPWSSEPGQEPESTAGEGGAGQWQSLCWTPFSCPVKWWQEATLCHRVLSSIKSRHGGRRPGSSRQHHARRREAQPGAEIQEAHGPRCPRSALEAAGSSEVQPSGVQDYDGPQGASLQAETASREKRQTLAKCLFVQNFKQSV